MNCLDEAKDNTQFLKALIVMVIFAGFIGMAFLPSFGFKAVDAGILQTTQAVVMLIVGFFFGSSSSGQKKDDTIANQLTQK